MKVKIFIWIFILFNFLNHIIFSQSIGNQTGNQFSFGISTNGTVYTWGYNAFGQIGDNTTTNRSSPVLVLKGAYSGTTYLGDDPDNKIIMMAIWSNSAIALDENGLVYTWGRNQYGQLGDNSTTTRNVPVKVLKGEYSGSTYLGDDSSNKIIAVSIGDAHSLALAADGTVYAWGLNTYGMLGNNNTTGSYTPIKVLKGEYSGSTYLGDDSSNKITAISAGAYFNHALAADGTVFAFGFNNNGQCGNGTVVNSSPYGQLTPVKVLKGTYSGTTYLGDDSSNKITAISGGNNWAGALGADGMVYLWGRNNHGQLADGTTTNRGAPVKALKGEYSGTTFIGDNSSNKIIGLAVSSVNGYALAADYTIFSWGYGGNGSLGNNTNNSSGTPVQVSGVSGSGDLTLPVELVSFEVKTDTQFGLTLVWITESELNNIGFILDRKTSSSDWSQIASYITNVELQGQGSVSYRTEYAYTDYNVTTNERYDYRLADVDYDGNIKYHSTQLMNISIFSSNPGSYLLHQNYPNPFNSNTKISYWLPEESIVNIKIYDISGNLVKKIIKQDNAIGLNTLNWGALNDESQMVSAGVYLYMIEAGGFNEVKKMIFLK